MGEVNFSVVQGDTFNIEVTYENPNGSSMDLTDFSAKMDVRNEPGGKILCASINSSNQIDIDGPNGKLTIYFTPAQTRKFTTPNAVYQLQIINNDTGEKTTLLNGHFSVKAAIVR